MTFLNNKMMSCFALYGGAAHNEVIHDAESIHAFQARLRMVVAHFRILRNSGTFDTLFQGEGSLYPYQIFQSNF